MMLGATRELRLLLSYIQKIHDQQAMPVPVLV